MKSRRFFLQQAAGLFTAAACPWARAASAAPETLSLGYGNYGMKMLPLREALAQCARIGYRNFEFTLYPGYSTNPEAMTTADRKAAVQDLREFNLTVSCLKSRPDTGADAAARRRGEEHVSAAARLALDLSAQNPPLIAVHAGGKTEEWEKLKAFILEQVGAWTAIATRAGVPFAIKAHAGNAVDRPDRLLWLLERIPQLKIVFDHSHFSLIDLDLAESLRALRTHLAMIQVKDARHGAGGKHEFVLPGDGGVDYGQYFRELDRLGFVGPVVVEVSAQIFNQPGYDPIAAAERSYRALARGLAARRAKS